MTDAAKSTEINNEAAKHIRKVTARVIEVQFRKGETGEVEYQTVEKANGQADFSGDPGKSQVVVEDPFAPLISTGKLIAPPFDLLALAMLPEHSSELGQCIEAMEVNISGTGYRLVRRLKKDEQDQESTDETAESKKASAQEKADLTNFFSNCTDESFIAFRRKLTKDQETTGNAFAEVVRNSRKEIAGFYHVPSYQMRLGPIGEEQILTDRKTVLMQADGTFKADTLKDWRRFRVYCQQRTTPTRGFAVEDQRTVRWFKQFGDKRDLNKYTGEFATTEKPVPENAKANEMLHFSIYSSRSAYGLPRYIGNLLSVYGDRAAEEINYMTFKNNNIPSMVVSVSNGQLTQATVERIQSFVQSQIQKSNNWSKFLIIEAEPFADQEGEDGGQCKIDIKPLSSNQIGDALFQNYSKNNQDKIRRSFRLPSIMVGISDDMNRAVAETARRLSDEQTFFPERLEFDSVMNRQVLPEMGIIYHEFRSNTPNTTDNGQLVRILASSEKTGGMTPRIARAVMEEILGKDLPPFPKDFDADKPFSLVMAETVQAQQLPSDKNDDPGAGEEEGGAAGGTDGRAGRDADGDGVADERGAKKKPKRSPPTVTKTLDILKALGILGADGSEIDGMEIEDVMHSIRKMQKAAEVMWRAHGSSES